MTIKHTLTVSNVFFVRGERTVLVDTGAPNSENRILSAMRKHGIAEKDVSLILLTHAHSDHAGSAAALREHLQVPVAVHAADREMLRRGTNSTFVSLGLEARMSRRFVDVPFPGLDADLLIDERTDLSAYGLDARIMHTPGHSEGSISLRLPNGDAIVGDILRGGMAGGMFLGGVPHFPYFLYDITDKAEVYRSVEKVFTAGAARFFVGHGGPISRQAVSAWLTAHRSERFTAQPTAPQANSMR